MTQPNCKSLHGYFNQQQQMEPTTTVGSPEIPATNESTKTIQSRGCEYIKVNEH